MPQVERVLADIAVPLICDHLLSSKGTLRICFGQERYRVLYQERSNLAIHHDRQVNTNSPCAQRDCPPASACVARLANRSLAWSILNLNTINESFSSQEIALAKAYMVIELDTSPLHANLERARQHDFENLMIRLRDLSNLDWPALASKLQTNEYGSALQLKELATAFTKRVRGIKNAAMKDDGSPNIHSFLLMSAAALESITGRPPDYQIPSWCLTSYDVDFDAHDCRSVGRGAFGRVVQGSWCGKVVAVKEFTPEAGVRDAVDSIKREVHIWSRLSHPNILRFYGASFEAIKPFIVSELCKAGTALRYLSQCPYVKRIKLLHDVSVGMVYLHDQGVIHADLKASNILIGDGGQALITDFGLSHVQDQVSSSVHVTRTSADKVGGTFRWMAPEVLGGKGLNKPADLYGFALVVWEFFTDGAVPFESITNVQILYSLVRKGQRPERPIAVTDDMWGLVQRCWKSDPYERPDFVTVEKTLAGLITANNKESTQPRPDEATVLISSINIPTVKFVPQATYSPEKSPTLDKIKRRLSIGAPLPMDGKGSVIKGFLNRRVFSLSTKSPKLECRSPQGRDGSNDSRMSEELDFILHVQKIPSISRILADLPELPTIATMLSLLYNLSLKVDGVSEVLAQDSLLPSTVSRLRLVELSEDERYLSTGFLANLACHGIGRTALIAQPELFPALSVSLTCSKSAAVLENTARCLYNLSTDDRSHCALSGCGELLASLGQVLRETPSPATVKSVLGYFTNLSHKEPGRSSMLSVPDALDGLIRNLQKNSMEDITKEQALMCLGNLTIDEKGVLTLLSHVELLHGLSACLCVPSTPATKAQALRCLRNVAKSPASHNAIRNCQGIILSVCNALNVHASSNQQKYALHFVHRFALSDVGKEWLQNERCILVALRWFADHGSSEDQTRAAACLRIAQA